MSPEHALHLHARPFGFMDPLRLRSQAAKLLLPFCGRPVLVHPLNPPRLSSPPGKGSPVLSPCSLCPLLRRLCCVHALASLPTEGDVLLRSGLLSPPPLRLTAVHTLPVCGRPNRTARRRLLPLLVQPHSRGTWAQEISGSLAFHKTAHFDSDKSKQNCISTSECIL